MIITAEQLQEALDWEPEKRKEFMEEFFELPEETQIVLNREAGNPLGEDAIRNIEVLEEELAGYRKQGKEHPDPANDERIRQLTKQIATLNEIAERFMPAEN